MHYVERLIPLLSQKSFVSVSKQKKNAKENCTVIVKV